MISHHRRSHSFLALFVTLRLFLVCPCYASAEEGAAKPSSTSRFQKLTQMLEGIRIGKDIRVFPYASLEDWFDPYAGLKFAHPVFWNHTDRLVQHAKFETVRDYSWKFRYVAHSVSKQNLLVSLLFKLKYDRDAFFYGVGNSTTKSGRLGTTYGSVFFGTELQTLISDNVVLRWSPGFWSFQSGLTAGGEFEEAADAQLITSRVALASASPFDYRSKRTARRVSGYIELGLATNEGSSYVRFNIESLTRLPLVHQLKFSVATRVEYIISPDREMIPYFALPEAGSRNGLRAYSKERFRNFALLVYNLELIQPISKHCELFLLSDFAQTGSDPSDLLNNEVHPSLGAGLRLLNQYSPIGAGIARGQDGWKIFSTISAALSF